MIRAVCFDLDGTVLDSKNGIFSSVSYALNHLGITMPDEKELTAFLGPPLSIGFKQVCNVPQEQVADAVRLYREYYNNSGGMFQASLYDGVSDCVQRLREKGIRIYITTSKPRVYAEKILDHFNALLWFDGVYGCELDGTRGKKAEVVRYCLEQEGISSHEAVLVGDRHFDVFGARECEMDCVGVLYGYAEKEELSLAGAAYIVKDCEELTECLLSLI